MARAPMPVPQNYQTSTGRRSSTPAPQMIETPAMRRSAMLAKLLEEQRQPVEIKGGYGELAARLLGQGITQFSANRAERAVRTEREQREAARRDALLGRLPSLDGGTATPPPVSGSASVPAASPSALAEALSPVVTNTQEPRFAETAPAAIIDGAPLPPPMPAQRQTLEDVLLAGASPPAPTAPPAQPTTLDDALLSGPLPMPQGAAGAAAPMPAAPQAMFAAPQAMPAPPAPAQNLRGPTPQEIALITQAAQSGDPGQLAWAEQTWGEIQMRMATPPEIDIAVAPDGTTYNRLDPASINRRFARVENINGFLRDVNDPNNIGTYVPDLQPGEEPVYGSNGNIVGVRNIDGSIQALGERTRATSDAQNASRASYAGVEAAAAASGRAPFEVERVVGPNGETITIPRSDLLAAGGIRGQAPAEAIEAQGEARNRVAAAETNRARASAAMRVLPTLDTMERLLPDVITGFNADLELQTARATAGMNPTARRRATATQTFQNEARQVVAGILPMFGTNPTEGERRYAEQMSGADVSYTPEALQDGINLARARAAREAVAANMPVPERLARYLPRGTVFIGEDNQRYRAP